MLWTTPESPAEQLPLVSSSGDLVITADARIDNRDELISALGLTDRRPAQITDSELILSAFVKWGEHCPEKLLGDFAFAIWVGHRRQLFCARDHFGVKPFYYYLSDKMFAFASEIKAIVSLSEIDRPINKI
jgi:asparagine synthase (glutamine-hydrolysing)